MKHRAAALLLGIAMAFGAQGALAQGATYVFPYEGLRYTQQAGETVLTQTNLDEHTELIASLGTTQEAILASYMAAGIVMEVIPAEGGQIAVSVADAGEFSHVKNMDELAEEGYDAFLAQFETSGLYETCEMVETEPVCVRLTSSAMYGSMPVYTLRYATLHLGRLCMLTQTVVGRAPTAQDDERVSKVLSGVRFLTTVSEPTPAPTPTPTASPTPSPVPTPGVAEVIAGTGEITVDGVPAYTNDATLTVSGTTAASAEVTVRVGENTIGRATAKKDGTFSVRVTLPEEGDLTLAVMTEEAEQMLAVRYEKPGAQLTITAPENPVFTGTNIVVRGETEPNATVFFEAEDHKTNVKANGNGSFSLRIYFDGAQTKTYTLTSKANGFKDTSASITLTRELTEKEWIAQFRTKVTDLDHEAVAANAQDYVGRHYIARGKVMEFTDYDGTPCALVCTGNPGTGIWIEPVWVILDEETDIEEEEIITFYLVCEGLTLPADGAYFKSGVSGEAPVMRMAHWSRNK